jgi:hypothetical protein
VALPVPVLTVEPVVGRSGVRRFRDLPFGLHRADPLWAPPLLAQEDARLEPAEGDVAAWLARRDGRPVGRIAASSEGRFGFFDCEDDEAAARALLDAALAWSEGAPLVGPQGFLADEERGVLVDGFGVAGTTGRPWHPPHLAQLLAHLDVVEDLPAWRLDCGGDGTLVHADLPAPAFVEGYRDPELARTDGEGLVLAVPDLAPVLRRKGLRSAWTLARTARTRSWETCTVVRCDGDPSALVPGLLGVAGRAGYRSCVAPWSPDPGRPPDVVHRLFGLA